MYWIEPPNNAALLKELSSYVPMEKIICNLKKEEKKTWLFEKTWGKFIVYMENCDDGERMMLLSIQWLKILIKKIKANHCHELHILIRLANI